jgi:hypothetical protein
MLAIILFVLRADAWGGAGFPQQLFDQWCSHGLNATHWPDDDGPAAGSGYLGDVVCDAVACKRVPGWIAIRPCNTHQIVGVPINNTCYYQALQLNGSTVSTVCGQSAFYFAGRCLCSDMTVLPPNVCRCTYAQRLSNDDPDCGPLDDWDESSNFNSTLISMMDCQTSFTGPAPPPPQGGWGTLPPSTHQTMTPTTAVTGKISKFAPIFSVDR